MKNLKYVVIIVAGMWIRIRCTEVRIQEVQNLSEKKTNFKFKVNKENVRFFVVLVTFHNINLKKKQFIN